MPVAVLGNGHSYAYEMDEFQISRPFWTGGEHHSLDSTYLQGVAGELSVEYRNQREKLLALCLGSAGINSEELLRNSNNTDSRRIRFEHMPDETERLIIDGQIVMSMSKPTVRVAEDSTNVSRLCLEYKVAILPFRTQRRMDYSWGAVERFP